MGSIQATQVISAGSDQVTVILTKGPSQAAAAGKSRDGTTYLVHYSLMQPLDPAAAKKAAEDKAVAAIDGILNDPAKQKRLIERLERRIPGAKQALPPITVQFILGHEKLVKRQRYEPTPLPPRPRQFLR
ncbi:hypothetical protein B0T26DRAFT_679979 [Lasiosphaeria miniovina]|uniref:Uncharacterized protein n=1 Tax=Lasiosphaeria miniovina TaxID=1954250 RepID=A0AA39ZYZ7_9PEZI|nr:uncharacterized protein B0T26DRAFT_679979 [Lasiosphaeria miniovina]KAK0706271.1 hypothetical protein B0T26DRAFT_679979 [Lasiosphaeria miniovina]